MDFLTGLIVGILIGAFIVGMLWANDRYHR